MKKVFLFLMVIALSLGTLSAQMTSIEGSTTYGLFNNALDAATTIDESVTDLDFSTLGKDYLFAGIVGNPQLLDNDDYVAAGLELGYYKAAEKPWSIFTNISWTGTGNQTGEVSDGENVTTKYNYKLFNTFHPRAKFLINLGAFSTGLGLGVYLEDNKDLSNNYEMVDTEFDIKDLRKAKNFTTDLSLSVPFYMEKEKLSHYASLRLELKITDEGGLEKTTVGGTTTADETTKQIGTTFSPSVFYKLSMPTEKLGTFYGSGRINLSMDSNSYEDEDNLTNNKASYKSKHTPGFGANLTAGLRMEQSTDGDWLRFRLNPEASYSFNSKSYQTGYTYSSTSGGTTNTTTYVGGKDQGISNSLTLSLKSAMEVKPEKWIVGLMLGARGSVGFENVIKTTVNSKPSNQEADNPTNKTVKNNWTALAYTNFGIFIPLPNGYRFDVRLNGSNALEFDSLTMQLIVPLGKTTGF